jgi:hypothetical protein
VVIIFAQHLRIWYRDRLLKRDKQPLRKQWVASDCTLTVQILPEAQPEHTSILTFLHRRLPPAPTAAGAPVVAGLGPAQEIFVDEGVSASVVRERMAKALGIEPAQLLLGKYLAYCGRWVRVDPDEAASGAKDKACDPT